MDLNFSAKLSCRHTTPSTSGVANRELINITPYIKVPSLPGCEKTALANAMPRKFLAAWSCVADVSMADLAVKMCLPWPKRMMAV
jgi:hypothetical protein